MKSRGTKWKGRSDITRRKRNHNENKKLGNRARRRIGWPEETRNKRLIAQGGKRKGSLARARARAREGKHRAAEKEAIRGEKNKGIGTRPGWGRKRRRSGG